VWSETIGRALDIAPRLQCGVVWINATNLFDASVGFGGYRESGSAAKADARDLRVSGAACVD